MENSIKYVAMDTQKKQHRIALHYPCQEEIVEFTINNTVRVEDWRVDLGRILYSPFTRPFVCECHNISTIPRLQSPPSQTQHAVFPHYAFLYASHQDLCGLSRWNCFRHR